MTRSIRTKEAALAFVCDVLESRIALFSLDFKDAMEVCERFDLRARDVLIFRKGRVSRSS